MPYDNVISRGDASARMPQNVMSKGKKAKPKEGETSVLRDAAKKKP